MTILRLTATDIDAGLNAQVLYSLEGGSSDDLSYFRIEPNTGMISLNRSLDQTMVGEHFLFRKVLLI